MSYQVLALKYRPRTFDEVVGQDHVTTTLSNAISQDRVAHAILFTGPRGTGKTTIARILARAMNCKKGPIVQPCNTCTICTDIIHGHCTDVFEIDGASNNSVDQIRDLRENVTYMPSSAAYKIYIIDEVHMLSTAAFNALLKTLEEPPDHVMFIFATTEVHKIPATILSRCQRHDLGRISLNMISDHLQHICNQEGYAVEKQSLDLIAQEADGSIRDSLSLLDRVLSSAGTREIDLDRVLENLGIQSQQIMHDISSAIFKNDGAGVIDIIEKVNDSGIDLKKFYTDIIFHFRNLNVIKLCGQKSLALNITDAQKEKISQVVSGLSGGFINTILQVLLDEESIVRYSSHTRTAVEMVLLKLLHVNPGAQIDTIISKLDILADQITSTSRNPGQSGTARSVPQPSVKTPQGTTSKKNWTSTERDTSAIKEPLPSAGFSAAKDASHTQQNIEPATVKKEKTWDNFLKKIEATLPFMFTLLSKGLVKEIDPDNISVELKNCSAFDKKRLKSKRSELDRVCREFLGKKLIVNITIQDHQSTQTSSPKGARAKQAAFTHPLVVEAQKLFNGEILNY